MTGAEIERYQPSRDVDSWTAVMPDVVKLADYVAQTEFVPKTLRNRPAAVAAAILSGREMGIGPMRALAHVHMVDGRPSLSAEQKRAAALAAGHDIVYVESTTSRCVVKGRRRGGQEWSTVTWTIDDAKNAKLAGKDNWRNYPRRMLQARATGELCDLIFPDASAGLATTEELEDATDAAGITTDGQPPPRRTAQRRTTVRAAATGADDRAADAEAVQATQPPQPPLPGEESDDLSAGVKPPHTTRQAQPATASHPPGAPEADAAPAETQPPAAEEGEGPTAGITKPQIAKTMALFNGLGIRDRDERLQATRIIVNRHNLQSANDLTTDNASALIETPVENLIQRLQSALSRMRAAAAQEEGE